MLTWISFYQNLITGTLPLLIGNMPRGSAVFLRITDNLFTGERWGVKLLHGTQPARCQLLTDSFCLPAHPAADRSGTVPVSLANIGNVALSYNSLLFGTLPWNVTISPDFLFIGGGWGNRFLTGTSIGLDRPMASILGDVRAAVNPDGATLASWGLGGNVQPCWQYSGQPSGRLTTGSVWLGVGCGDTYSGVGFYRQVFGAVSSISLSGRALGGSLPSVVRLVCATKVAGARSASMSRALTILALRPTASRPQDLQYLRLHVRCFSGSAVLSPAAMLWSRASVLHSSQRIATRLQEHAAFRNDSKRLGAERDVEHAANIAWFRPGSVPLHVAEQRARVSIKSRCGQPQQTCVVASEIRRQGACSGNSHAHPTSASAAYGSDPVSPRQYRLDEHISFHLRQPAARC